MQPKLSKPITQLKASYEIIVIGSGYGGSITASRMARAGRQVCLLEKGREIRPGEFPDKISEAGPQLQIHTEKGHFGDDTGLYEVYVGNGINVVKGCGLGGTSLINANVSIEPEPRVFERNAWPTAIKNDLKSVFDGMEKAREMLKPTQYPVGKPGYPELAKSKAHKLSADALAEPFRYLDINVNFEDKTVGNHVGVAQKACNNCGDCCSGCNVSAKNTTLMNYLPDAVNHGAEIYCEIGVSHLERVGDKWHVFYNILNVGREKFLAPAMFIEADMVFLGAGALGSTQILLKSGIYGKLNFSDKLGDQFTGNGDVLGFAYNTDIEINGIGFGDKNKENPVGPCITSVIDARNKPILEDGMVIEEGSVPGAIRPILKPMLFVQSRTDGENTETGFDNWAEARAREAVSLFQGADHGALNNTQIYLIMAHDSDAGKMSLTDSGDLTIDWEGVGKEKIFEKANENLHKSTKAMGGVFVKNPVWTEKFDFDLVTVHPLGGCIMADTAEKGVTNHVGQVFRGKTGADLYPNLFVTDGAIIPCSLGTNPLLTISGLAERNSKLIAEQNGWAINYDFESRKAKEAQPQTTGVMFTETMKGFFTVGEKDDFKQGAENGKKVNSSLEFTLTILAEDVDEFVENPQHQAGMAGSVIAPHISAKPMAVSEGRFNLFVKDATNADQKYMQYQMKLHTAEGKTYFFKGFKDVRDDPGFDMWSDLSTLFITIFDGENESAPILGKGILHIEMADFAKQITTMKALNTKGIVNKSKGLLEFGKLFGGDVFDTYF
jgi:cholesterol oxidase